WTLHEYDTTENEAGMWKKIRSLSGCGVIDPAIETSDAIASFQTRMPQSCPQREYISPNTGKHLPIFKRNSYFKA
ncbi:hypothetical protein TNCV_1390661, partial [Trichonephila clavipes]